MCHLNGIAVLFDLVYNHAGGDFGDRDLWFFDRQPGGDANRSLYFSDQEWAGGMVFAYWQAPVRQFLIDNAVFCLNEYHIDGGRYDEITVINSHGGTEFCRNLADIVRSVCPQAVQIADTGAGTARCRSRRPNREDSASTRPSTIGCAISCAPRLPTSATAPTRR